MFYDNLVTNILLSPLTSGANELRIISGYATPLMCSWYMEQLSNFPNYCKYPLLKHSSVLKESIDIHLIVGMVPCDGISIPVHRGFIELVENSSAWGKTVNSFMCSYVMRGTAFHSNLYLWLKDSVPILAYQGSANFLQGAFGHKQKGLMSSVDPAKALEYYDKIEGKSIYCNHSEVEEEIILTHTHPVLDVEYTDAGEEISIDKSVESIVLSLLTNKGAMGMRSGLNWGQRPNRNPNEAYLRITSKQSKLGFFPIDGQHFSVVTDDGHLLILRVQQDNEKAITTPHSNALIGTYFRNRLGLADGSFVKKEDLEIYGRTEVAFYKFDDEQYYMDFSV